MACPIYVFDTVPNRRARVIAELRPLLDTATIIDSDLQRPGVLEQTAQPSVALLGLDASGNDAELPVARTLSSKGLSLLVYADRWQHAPLSRR